MFRECHVTVKLVQKFVRTKLIRIGDLKSGTTDRSDLESTLVSYLRRSRHGPRIRTWLATRLAHIFLEAAARRY